MSSFKLPRGIKIILVYRASSAYDNVFIYSFIGNKVSSGTINFDMFGVFAVTVLDPLLSFLVQCVLNFSVFNFITGI